MYTVSQKNCADMFLLQLRPISTNLDNFWQKDGKEDKLYQMDSFSISPNLHHHTTVLNADVQNCYITLKVVICNNLSDDLISKNKQKMWFI